MVNSARRGRVSRSAGSSRPAFYPGPFVIWTVSEITPAASGPAIFGIAPGMVDPVLSVLRSSSGPVRRRKLLEELEHRGHRISLAGLNRILQHCLQAGLTTEGSDGVRLKSRTP